MKVTIDLSKLLAENEITQEEYARLLTLSSKDTGSLAFNILVAFGVIAMSGGLLALFPSPYTSMTLGLMAGILGVMLGYSSTRWNVLSVVSTLVGALLLGGGILAIAKGSSSAFLLVAAIFLFAGIAARSGLLISLAVLAVSSSIGARTDYAHATYSLGIELPAVTIILFSVIAIGAFQLSKLLSHEFSRLAIIASRTSVFLVNFGFWVGSLWGNQVVGNFTISNNIFIIGWAVALLATGIWGAFQNRRWIVNTSAVFGGIHFYTQWFEHLGASPGSIIIAGLLAIGGAIALRSFNVRLGSNA